MKKLEVVALALIILLLFTIVAVTGVFYFSFILTSPPTAHVILSEESSQGEAPVQDNHLPRG